MIDLFREHIDAKKYSNVSVEFHNVQDPQLSIEFSDTISSSLVFFFLPDLLLALQQ